MKYSTVGLTSAVALLMFAAPLIACNHPHCKCVKTTTRVQTTTQVITQAAPQVVLTQAAPQVVLTQAAPQVVLTQAAPQMVLTQAAPQMVLTQVAPQAAPQQTFTIQLAAPQASQQVANAQLSLIDFSSLLTGGIQNVQIKNINDKLATMDANIAAIKASSTNIEANSKAILDLLTGKPVLPTPVVPAPVGKPPAETTLPGMIQAARESNEKQMASVDNLVAETKALNASVKELITVLKTGQGGGKPDPKKDK